MSSATAVPIGLIHSFSALTHKSLGRLRVVPDNGRVERRHPARSADERLSQHPTDRLIRQLIRFRWTPTLNHRRHIVERLLHAPFNLRILPIRPEARGLRAAGIAPDEPTDALSFPVAEAGSRAGIMYAEDLFAVGARIVQPLVFLNLSSPLGPQNTPMGKDTTNAMQSAGVQLVILRPDLYAKPRLRTVEPQLYDEQSIILPAVSAPSARWKVLTLASKGE